MDWIEKVLKFVLSWIVAICALVPAILIYFWLIPTFCYETLTLPRGESEKRLREFKDRVLKSGVFKTDKMGLHENVKVLKKKAGKKSFREVK